MARPDLESLKSQISSILVGTQSGCTTRELAETYKQFFPDIIDPKAYGFRSLDELLASDEMRDTVRKRGQNWFAVATEKNAEMIDLVSKTKSKGKKKTGSHQPIFRATGINSRPPTSKHLPRNYEKLKTNSDSSGFRIAGSNFAKTQIVSAFNSFGNAVMSSELSNPEFTPNAVRSSSFSDVAGAASNKVTSAEAAFSYKDVQHQQHSASSHGIAVLTNDLSYLTGFRGATALDSRTALQNLNLNSQNDQFWQNTPKFLPKPNEQRRIALQYNPKRSRGSYGAAFMKPEEVLQRTDQRTVNLLSLRIPPPPGLSKQVSTPFAAVPRESVAPLDDSVTSLNPPVPPPCVPNDSDVILREERSCVRSLSPISAASLTKFRNTAVDRDVANALASASISEPDAVHEKLSRRSQWLSRSYLEKQGMSRLDPTFVGNEKISYKVMFDKIIDFLQRKGPLKIDDLSEFFAQGHGLRVLAVDYKEGTWKAIIEKIISKKFTPKLIIRGDMVDLEEKSSAPSTSSEVSTTTEKTKCNSETSEKASVISKAAKIVFHTVNKSNEHCVPQEMVFSKLIEEGLISNRKEGVKILIEVCRKYPDVFTWEFPPKGALLRLTDRAMLPIEEEQNGLDEDDDDVDDLDEDIGPQIRSVPSPILNSPRIPTQPHRVAEHILSHYNSSEERLENLYKPIVVVDLRLDEPAASIYCLKISFLLSIPSAEQGLASLQRDLYDYYDENWNNDELKVDLATLTVGCDYAVLDTKELRVYRARFIKCSEQTSTLTFLKIDSLLEISVGVGDVRKLAERFEKIPTFGVEACTGRFTINASKQEQFASALDSARCKLCESKSLLAYIRSEPEKKIFEILQIRDSLSGLAVPLQFKNAGLVRMIENEL